MRSIVNRFTIVVCTVVSLTFSSDVITNANWSGIGESSAFGYDVTCGPLAMAIDKSGNIYASQWDLFAGGKFLQNFAKWDHHQWTSIEFGIDSLPLYSMFFDSVGNNLYVGGWWFVKKYNGVSWQKMGKELIGMVTGLAVNKRGELFAGTFESQDHSYIYKWSDTAWVIIGEIPNGHVNDLACDSSGNLYVCGKFDFIGGIGSNSVAKWDGTKWSSLEGGCWSLGNSGDPFIGEVNYVKCIGNDVYFAGGFDSCGSKNIHAVARWDGSTWSNVGKGTASIVSQLVTDKYGCLYALGCHSLQKSESYNVMKLIKDEWVVLDAQDTMHTLNIIIDTSGTIFGMGSNFSQLVDGKWSLISNGEGFDGDIYAFAYDRLSGYLYAGGSFSTIGNKRINHIARWDGKSWNNLGNGISSAVLSLAVGKNGTVYAGGTTCGEEPNGAIYAWNGESWTEIAQFKQKNSCCQINTLAFDSLGNLYAGGAFSALNDIPLRNIARWDGKSWYALGDGIDGFNVNALAFDNKGTLYAGGDFDKAGTEVCHNIARWDGTAWHSLGEGVKKDLSILECVNALVIDTTGNLYAGGGFSMAGGIEVQNIAKWDGVSWSSLGSGIGGIPGNSSTVNTLAFDENGNLYAGGNFKYADSIIVNSIARWDGSKWDSLGSGVKISNNLIDERTGEIRALECNGKGMLYAGGEFYLAAGKISSCFAQCNLTGPSPVLSRPGNKTFQSISKIKNELMLVRCRNTIMVRYCIYSISGRQISHNSELIPAGEHKLRLKTNNLSRGAYIADVRAGDALLRYMFMVK